MKLLCTSLLLCFPLCYIHAQNVFPSTGNVGIGTAQPASLLQVTGGSTKLGGAKNYVSVDSAGNLSFTGNSVYKVAANKYAFQYSGNTNYGLFFNASALQYEFRNGSATSVFSINANKGDVHIGGAVYFDSSVYLQGQKFISITDTANLFIGSNAGIHNAASYNTTLGYNTLYANITGYANTAVGSYALYSNLSGRANTATGYNALYSNQISEANTATGATALYNNKSGDGNTATGVQAMYFNTIGWHNTSTGVSSLYSNISGAFQSAHGFEALYFNTTGAYNTATAYHALYNNVSGNNNVAVGVRALEKNVSGSNNTALGTDAGVNTTSLTNAMAIGANATVNASNKVVIGNNAVTVIGGVVGWSTLSDGRFKKNIKSNVPGLIFINQLQPVTYTFDAGKFERFLNRSDSASAAQNTVLQGAEKKIHSGFIAQDVEKAAAAVHYDFDGINKPKNDKDNYSLVYSDLIPSLVKSVQELSKENDELKQEIRDIKAMLQTPADGVTNKGTNTSRNGLPETANMYLLRQNSPNPCQKSTVISYTLPATTNTAWLMVLNADAEVMTQVKLAPGKGQITLDVSSLPNGVYHYFILANGTMLEAKKLIVAH